MKSSVVVFISICLLFGTMDSNSAIPRGGDSSDLIKLKTGDIVASTMDSTSMRNVLENAASTNAHLLLRFVAIPSAQDRDDLESGGISLLSYIPYLAWTARVDSVPPMNEVLGLGIEWAGELTPENKIDLAIQNEEFYPWATDEYGKCLALVWFHRDVTRPEATTILDTSSVLEYDYLPGVNSFTVLLDPEDIADLALIDEVFWVDQVQPPLEECMDEARPVVHVGEVQAPPYSLSGAGVNVMVAEPSMVTQDHIDLTGRVLWEDDPGPVRCCTPGNNSHTSMVGGIIAGNGTHNSSFSGMAPEAFILSFSTQHDATDLSTDFCSALDGLIGSGGDHVADLANLSINYNLFPPDVYGAYDIIAILADKVALGQNEECLGSDRLPLFWATGNEGVRIGWRSVGSGAVGKNTISVGAIDPATLLLAPFSSRGPTNDNRIKPDVCAPGVDITSCDCDESHGTGYCTTSGTSFACPIVAGGAATIVEKLLQSVDEDRVEASLLKAILVASAQDLGNEGPDFKYGFGLLNVLNAIGCVDSGEFGGGDLEQNEEDIVEIYISDSDAPLIVAVCWDDWPAEPNVDITLVNDIDIYLESPNQSEIYPYHLNGNPRHEDDPAVREPDHENNVEQVVVGNPESGVWRLHITGHSIVADNDDDPGGGPQAQTYSYAISRGTSTQYVNRSDNIQFEHDLNYGGTPYSAVAWSYEGNNDIDPIDDLFVSISGGQSVGYKGLSISAIGVPHYQVLQPIQYEGSPPPDGLRGLAVADMNKDGIPELFAAHESTPKLYRWNEGTGKMEDRSDETGIDLLATDSTAGAWGHFDDNEYLDLFVCRATGYVEDPPEMEATRLSPASRLLKNDDSSGERVLVGAGLDSGIAQDLSSACAAWCDYNGDGKEDLFIGTFNNPGSKLYKNLGGAFEDVTNDLGPNWERNRVTGCVWGFLNNDEHPDLVLSHFIPSTGTDGQIDIFFGKENGMFDDGQDGAAPRRIGSHEGYSGVAVYDYNLDTLQDILALSDDASRGPDLFENRTGLQGAPTFVNVTPAVGLVDPNGTGTGYIHGAVIADFGYGPNDSELDGIPDLYLGRPVSSESFLYVAKQSSSSSRHFVKVRLLSSSATDNQMGIGAKVAIDSDGQRQYQIVDGGSMRGGQSGNELIFGLGAYDGSVTATVYWPSGYVQPDVPLLLDQLNIIENSPVLVDDSTVSATYQAHPGGSADWYFTWESNTVGDPAYDCVIFDMPGIPPQCQPSHSSIDNTTEDVSLSVVAQEGGNYRHQMVWANPPCVPGCNIGFWVSSGSSAQADTSDTLEILKVKICTN